MRHNIKFIMDTPTGPQPQSTIQTLSVPIAIVIAGALIAVSLYFVGGTGAGPTTSTGTPTEIDVPGVTAEDHILGNPDAEIFIVEYTDFDCPFCKQYHATMKQIIAEYGPSGKVAWVMRNFPLAQLHPNAPKLAEAAECVADLGGNDAYWKFLDEMFAAAPVGSFTEPSALPGLAAKVGITTTAFSECYSAGTFKAKVEQEFNDAVASGGQGTPHNIVVTKNGKTVPIPGAQPYATIKSIIDTVLAEN